MTFKNDNTLSTDDQEILIALDRYLIDRRVAEQQYFVGPATAHTSAPCTLLYNVKAIAPGLTAEITWPMADGSAKLVTKLASGIRLFAMLLGDGWLEKTQLPLSLGPRDSIAQAGLSSIRHWSNNLEAPADTTFIAPFKDGYALAYMDVRPPAEIQAWSPSAAAVAVNLAVAEAEGEAHIAEVLATFLP